MIQPFQPQGPSVFGELMKFMQQKRENKKEDEQSAALKQIGQAFAGNPNASPDLLPLFSSDLDEGIKLGLQEFFGIGEREDVQQHEGQLQGNAFKAAIDQIMAQGDESRQNIGLQGSVDANNIGLQGANQLNAIGAQGGVDANNIGLQGQNQLASIGAQGDNERQLAGINNDFAQSQLLQDIAARFGLTGMNNQSNERIAQGVQTGANQRNTEQIAGNLNLANVNNTAQAGMNTANNQNRLDVTQLQEGGANNRLNRNLLFQGTQAGLDRGERGLVREQQQTGTNALLSSIFPGRDLDPSVGNLPPSVITSMFPNGQAGIADNLAARSLGSPNELMGSQGTPFFGGDVMQYLDNLAQQLGVEQNEFGAIDEATQPQDDGFMQTWEKLLKFFNPLYNATQAGEAKRSN